MAHPNSTIWKIIPRFKTTSIQRTADFYTTHLSFKLGGVSDTFCSVFTGRDAAANIYFFKCSEDEFHPCAAMIATGTKQLDEIYNSFRANENVVVLHEIGDKEWGYRQFTIKDDGGNELTFFRFLEGTNGPEEAAEEEKKKKVSGNEEK